MVTRAAVAAAEGVRGWMSRAELEWLSSLAASLPEGVAWAEVGSWCGRSAVCVGLSLPPGSSLWLIDPLEGFIPRLAAQIPDPDYPRRELMANAAMLWRERPTLRGGVLAMTGCAAAVMVPDPLDVAFLDGDHTHAGVLLDCRTWGRKLRPGGVLCGHDHGHPLHPGVASAVKELFGDRATVAPGTSIWSVRVRESIR